ncbi:MAG: nitrous oxide reductase family maturation protein NosD [Promethearchaeota archaeon]
MRNKSIIKISILTLGILFALLTMSSISIIVQHINKDGAIEIRDEPKLKNLKKSGGYSESFIHVDGSISGNWTGTTDYPWCYIDNGVYILENVTINASTSPMGSGIFINNSKNEYFIIRNCTVYNSDNDMFDAGIKLENTSNGTLLNNNCSNNRRNGVLLNNCHNSSIVGNIFNDNYNGVFLYSYCSNITISVNIFNQDHKGVYLEGDCNDNTISENILSGDYMGIDLESNCNKNNISRNIAEDYDYGIFIESYSDNNIVSENTVNNNSIAGIMIFTDCDNNLMTRNIANNNDRFGIVIFGNLCEFNNITDNYFYFNKEWAIFIEGSDSTLIESNILVSTDENFIDNNGINTLIYPNLYLTSAPSLYVEIINQSLSTNRFIISFNISSILDSFDYITYEFEIEFIEIWWNGTVVPSNNITILGNRLYNVSIAPIFVAPGEDPILLNMIISAKHHSDKYFEKYIAVEPFDLDDNILDIDIIDQSFSTEEFNLTFFVYNILGHGVDFSTIEMWWNSVKVSNDVQNLGNGYYFISLEPITTALGENPILLNMTISASGYVDKYFETFIAVEPSEAPEPCEIIKFLNVEITENSYSLEHFNLTFFVGNETELGIDSATIQVWWNGTDVSSDVINLGNGLYFVSLESITVAPGEDPILLSMIISADGYEDKYFETYLAVDPDTLEKGVGQDGDEFPSLILIIVLISAAGGIGATIITVGILRKRKPAK